MEMIESHSELPILIDMIRFSYRELESGSVSIVPRLFLISTESILLPRGGDEGGISCISNTDEAHRWWILGVNSEAGLLEPCQDSSRLPCPPPIPSWV